MTNSEILSLYAVDVSKLSTAYSSYHIATSNDMWLRTVGAYKLKEGDLIIITPDNYRSRIYSYKIPARHVNLDGPDFYYYTYSPSSLIDTLSNCVSKYVNICLSGSTYGTMAVRFDVNNTTLEIFIDITNHVTCATKVETLGTLESISLSNLLKKYGKRVIVQNYIETDLESSHVHWGFVGD